MSLRKLTFIQVIAQEGIKLFPPFERSVFNVMLLQTFPPTTVMCENYGVISGAMGITGIPRFEKKKQKTMKDLKEY